MGASISMGPEGEPVPLFNHLLGGLQILEVAVPVHVRQPGSLGNHRLHPIREFGGAFVETLGLGLHDPTVGTTRVARLNAAPCGMKMQKPKAAK